MGFKLSDFDRRKMRGPQAPVTRIGGFSAGKISDKPGCLCFTVPIRTVNPLNNRQIHWTVWKRGQEEKSTMASHLLTVGLLPALPVTVEFVRLGKGWRPFDPDGLAASLKHVRDSVAAAYGIDDADPRIEFPAAKQEVRQPEFGVRITIRTRADQ